MAFVIPIRTDFPNISRNVMDSIAIRLIATHWSRTHKPIPFSVGGWKGPIPCIAVGLTFFYSFISPRQRTVEQPAAGGPLPLCLSRKSLTEPICVGDCIFIGHMNNRVILQPFQVAVRSKRMTPIRSQHPRPPLGIVDVIENCWVGCENHRTREKIFLVRPRSTGGELLFEFVPVEGALGDCLVSSCSDEFAKRRIGHFMYIHQKSINVNPMTRILSSKGKRIFVCTHPKVSRRYGNHRSWTFVQGHPNWCDCVFLGITAPNHQHCNCTNPTKHGYSHSIQWWELNDSNGCSFHVMPSAHFGALTLWR